jgi:hypothetical protein
MTALWLAPPRRQPRYLVKFLEPQKTGGFASPPHDGFALVWREVWALCAHAQYVGRDRHCVFAFCARRAGNIGFGEVKVMQPNPEFPVPMEQE